MAAPKFLRNVGGTPTEIAAIEASAGGADAEKVVATDINGRLDLTFMPTGVGPDTASIVSSENLAAGDFVNIHSSSGFKVRKADASTTGKEADGFVLSAVTSPAAAIVYFAGRNTAISGTAVPGEVFLSDTVPGGYTATAPTGAGKIAQRIGVAVSASEINFEKLLPIVLAA